MGHGECRLNKFTHPVVLYYVQRERDIDMKKVTLLLAITLFVCTSCAISRETPSRSTHQIDSEALSNDEISLQSEQTSIAAGSGNPKGEELVVTQQLSLFFEDEIADVYLPAIDDVEPARESNLISVYQGFLYYLTSNGKFFWLNKMNLSTGATETVYETREDISSFCIINQDEFIFHIEGEHELGPPTYLTKPYYFNRKTGELTLFTEKYGLDKEPYLLKEIPDGAIREITYYDGCFYFRYGADPYGSTLLYCVDRQKNEVLLVHNYFNDISFYNGLLYVGGSNSISAWNPDNILLEQIFTYSYD